LSEKKYHSHKSSTKAAKRHYPKALASWASFSADAAKFNPDFAIPRHADRKLMVPDEACVRNVPEESQIWYALRRNIGDILAQVFDLEVDYRRGSPKDPADDDAKEKRIVVGDCDLTAFTISGTPRLLATIECKTPWSLSGMPTKSNALVNQYQDRTLSTPLRRALAQSCGYMVDNNIRFGQTWFIYAESCETFCVSDAIEASQEVPTALRAWAFFLHQALRSMSLFADEAARRQFERRLSENDDEAQSSTDEVEDDTDKSGLYVPRSRPSHLTSDEPRTVRRSPRVTSKHVDSQQ
jgi:hypothetical protein